MLPGRNLKQTSNVPSVVAFRANAIVRRVRGMGMVHAVTRNASKSPIESEVLKLKRDKRGMRARELQTHEITRCNLSDNKSEI